MVLSTRIDRFFPGDDPILVNSIRLTIFQLVPHFAFNREKVVIRTNTSGRTNDEISQEISTMVVSGVTNSRATYNQFLSENPVVVRGDDPGESTAAPTEDGERVVIGGDVLTLSLRVVHDDDTVQFRYVTTQDCRFAVNGKAVADPYAKNPLLLLTLKHGEVIDLEAKTDMNIPLRNPLYMAVGNAWFRKEKSGYRFFMDLRPGITEKEVFYRARDLLLKRVQTTIQRFKNQEDAASAAAKHKVVSGEIVVGGDRFIVSNLLSFYMASHPSVSFAGPRCRHLLGSDSSIFYRATGDIKKILDDVYTTLEKDTNMFVIREETS